MYGKGRIIPALILFLGLVTSPMWYKSGDAGKMPKPEKPKDYTECVAPTQYMRTSHMVLLNEWRDDILREGGPRIGKTANGTEYVRSLQNGCMKCHSDKKKFCDDCHNYASVKPYCWDCHLQPKEAM
ncbi:MAG: sulfate reduction electron transfer complex DsrMKJOP subunit DsrJ [Desulfobulbaceae bacterium]|nr:sulfate reduction electron transfer complex DsrMKJOP subunit DsrJ [Desulfobulbaceae bacterium]HIJ89485.1 sulfate reduction electron transfer complex DsrMKJOP subunit DsrJ [Deltaproteobacteria bacterium]